MAEIKFLGYLSEIAGARKKNLLIEKPIPLRMILPSPFPHENIIILIDDKVGSFGSLIEDSSSIVIMPMLSGG